MTHLSLFSGIGGLDLAAEWAGFETVGQCEWADYPTKVLEKHWPDVPRWRDIRTLTSEDFHARTGLRTVDVISGGFPCQPFSVAGKQKGKGDDRYLWPEMLRVIRELGPRWVVGENVPGILRIAATDVIKDLEREGYSVVVLDFEAAAVGAPHRRERIAFVAHRDGMRKQSAPGLRAEGRDGIGNGGADVAHAGRAEPQGRNQDAKGSAWRARNELAPCGGADRETHPSNGIMENACRGGCVQPEDVRQQPERTEFERSGQIIPDPESVRRGTWRPEPAGQQGKSLSGYGGASYSHANGKGLQGRQRERVPERAGERIAGEGGAFPADAESAKREWNGQIKDWAQGRFADICRKDNPRGQPDGSAQWAVEPDVGRVANGVPSRVDRLKCLGNAVVPQQFYPIFLAIKIEIAREETMP